MELHVSEKSESAVTITVNKMAVNIKTILYMSTGCVGLYINWCIIPPTMYYTLIGPKATACLVQWISQSWKAIAIQYLKRFIEWSRFIVPIFSTFHVSDKKPTLHCSPLYIQVYIHVIIISHLSLSLSLSLSLYLSIYLYLYTYVYYIYI